MNYIPTDRRLQYDVEDEMTNVGRLSSRFAKGKKSGGGWGALIGGILGQILIPIPGVGAAIGAGIGGAGGSMVGGYLSGVTQDDIREGKFKKDSREDILKTIGKNQLNQSLMSAAKYGMMGMDPSSMLSKGASGFKAGAAGGGGLLGGLKGAGGLMAGDPAYAVLGDTPATGGWAPTGTGGMTNQMSQQHMAGEAMDYNINDIVKMISDSGANTLGRTADTIGGNIQGSEIVETLDTSDMAQNLVQSQDQDYLDWLEWNEGQ